MPGIGTVINVALVIIGGVLGLFIGKLMKQRFRDIIISAVGVSVIVIGLEGSIEKMMTEYDISSASKSVMLVVSLALGSVIGEGIDFDKRISQFGEWLKRKTNSTKDARFVNGFLTTSVTVCVGAMAVVGSIEDGVNHDFSILFIKSVIDMITIMIMTASMGKGCIFSAIPIAIFQGSITALSGVIGPVLTDTALNNLSLVGSALIFCVGLNLLRKTSIKVANMLPAIFVAVGWAYIPFLCNL